MDRQSIGKADGIRADPPFAGLPEKEWLWLGDEQLGMRRSEVDTVLGRRSPPILRTGTDRVVHAPGLHPLEDHEIRTWTGVVGFRDDVPVRLSMDASG